MPVYKTKEEKTKDNRIWYFKCNYKDMYGNIKTKKSKKYATKEEATREEAKFKISIGDSIISNYTFNEIYKEYITKLENNVRPQTIIKKNNLYKYIEPILGNVKIENLTMKQYEYFKSELNKKNISTDYKNRIHALIITLVNYSEDYYNVTTKVPKISGRFENPLEMKKEMQFFTKEEYDKFRSVIEKPLWQTIFDTLFYCGLRKGELQALTWKDINFDKNTLDINKTLTTKLKGVNYSIFPPKTKSSYRTLPIPTQLRSELQNLFNLYSSLDGFNDNWFVFGGIRPTPETTIQFHKDKYCKLANVKNIRIHDFRHSCASLLISKNADPVLVAKYLGHANVSMTLNRYSHMYKSKLDEIINLFEN